MHSQRRCRVSKREPVSVPKSSLGRRDCARSKFNNRGFRVIIQKWEYIASSQNCDSNFRAQRLHKQEA